MIIKFKLAGTTTTVKVLDLKKDAGLKDKACDFANADHESTRSIKESEFSHKVEKSEKNANRIISAQPVAKPQKSKKRKRASPLHADKLDKLEKKKKPKTEIPKSKVRPTPGLAVNLLKRIEEMGGSVPQLLIQKRVTKTDSNYHHARLSIPLGQIKDKVAFMKEAEIRKNKDFEVTLIVDPNMEEYTLGFNKWGMSSSFTYNLINGKRWDMIRTKNGIVEGHCVQLWWFRRKSRLCLVLVNLSNENSTDMGNLREAIVDTSTMEEAEEKEEDTRFVAAGLVEPRRNKRKGIPRRSPLF